MNRNKHTQLKYIEWIKKNQNSPCTFCFVPKRQIFKEFKYFKIIKNNFPYDIWDYRKVIDHKTVIPKRHIMDMKALSKIEKKEYLDIICQYENIGYNFYTRTDTNKSKSINHFHTHLIKTKGKPFDSLIYKRNPYVSRPIWKRNSK